MQELLNAQYHRELFSANQYLAMSSYFLDRDLDGFANFFRIQAEEEKDHAMRQYDYVHDVDGKITHEALEAPQNDFSSLLEVFEKAFGHEQYITRNIFEIVKTALEESDFATHQFFQWFVAEQVEEESLFRTLIAKIKLAGENQSALYLLNEELLARKPGEEEEE
ncbi:MAG: ferritin [Bacteroidota bacterium]